MLSEVAAVGVTEAGGDGNLVTRDLSEDARWGVTAATQSGKDLTFSGSCNAGILVIEF